MEKEILKKLESSIGSLVLTYHSYIGMHTDTMSARKEIFSTFLKKLTELLINDDLTIEQSNEIKEHIYAKVGELLGRR